MRLTEESRFKTDGVYVYGLCVTRDGLLAACGGWRYSPWAAMYTVDGTLQARLQLPERCNPFDLVEADRHLLLTDRENNCLQVGRGRTPDCTGARWWAINSRIIKLVQSSL